MRKPPPNLPSVGDRCKLRGREVYGILRKVYGNLWAEVEWNQTGPTVCHLWELEEDG